MPMTEPERHETARQKWAAFEALRRMASRISRRGAAYARAVVQGARRGRAATGAPDQDPPGAGAWPKEPASACCRSCSRCCVRPGARPTAAGSRCWRRASWPSSSPTPRRRSGSTVWQGAFYDAIERRDLPAFVGAAR